MKPPKVFHNEIGIPNCVGLFMPSMIENASVLFQASEM